MKMYDEKDAIAFMRSNVDAAQLTDDDILDIIDAIFEFYDENGDLDLDFDEDEEDVEPEADEQAIIDYVVEAFSDTAIPQSLITELVKAEIAYEQSLL
ncbi:MAG: hypothetical protein K2J10_09900 [Muribaculaceae bacterium]|nr:hypothetical protein [Muribaculaceae bacterium]